jgi:diguanylate cyclase (GGDEF)-like protein/PAS domain S-box-containing protein
MMKRAETSQSFAIHADLPAATQPVEPREEALRRLASLAIKAVNAGAARFWFGDGTRTEPSPSISVEPHQPRIEEGELAQAADRAIASGQPSVFTGEATPNDIGAAGHPRYAPITTYLALPLRHRGLLSAALVVSDGAPRQWSAGEISILTDITCLAETVLASTQADTAPSRTEALAALEESERRFRNVFAEVAVGEITTSIDGRFLQVNRAFCQITGYSEPELQALDILSITHPEDIAKSADRYRQLIEDSIPYFQLETRYIRRDGRIVSVQLSSSLTSDADGLPLYVIGLVQDVSERKMAEGTLRRTNETLRALIQASPLAITAIDRNSRIRSWNPAAEQLFGWTEQEVLGQACPMLVELEDSIDQGLLHSALNGKMVKSQEFQRKTKSGSIVDISVSTARLASGPEHDVGWSAMAIINDISERKQAEARVREAELRYRSLVEQVPAVIYMAADDESYTTVYASPQISELLGCSAEEWTRNPEAWGNAVHPDDRDRVVARSKRGGGAAKFESEYRLQTREGGYIWVRDEAVLMVDDAGNPLYWQGFLTDIDERKRAVAELVTLENKYRSLIDNASDFIVMYDLSGRLTFVNQMFIARFGYAFDEALDLSIYDIVHPEDVAEVRAYFGQRLRGDRVPGLYQLRATTKAGEVVYMDVSASPIVKDGVTVAFQAVARDISERYLAEQRLAESEQRYRSLFYHNPDAVFSLDPRGNCLTANPACEQITGYPIEAILATPWSALVVPEDHPRTLRHIARTARGDAQAFEISILRKSGERARLHVTTLPIIVNGQIVGIYGIAKDETERRTLEERLAHQAFHDSLTHLPNRNLFLDRLQHALARAGRNQTMLAVLFLDLDNFKVINDSLGHEVGDQLLISVAERLNASMRADDTAARLGGDEFILLLEEINSVREAERVAQRIHDILKAPFNVGHREVYVTSSIGIAISTSAGDRPDELLRNADVAMYGAKRNGRACCEVFSQEMHSNAVQRLELEQDLRQAIERQEFRVDYQPKLDIRSGQIVELEALARWHHPTQGIIVPGEFIPLAEETGLIVPIGQWILREACRQLKSWQSAFPKRAPSLVSVNLSAVQLRFSTLVDDVAAALEETNLDPSSLCLEITESAVMDNAQLAMSTLTALKELGVHLAIDDFGTGYSSLSYLKRFPVDVLKIDQSFIEELGTSQENSVIVGVTIRLAHALGMRVVAEGVETAQQLSRLRELDCDLAQGFYISRPLRASAVESLIAEQLV